MFISRSELGVWPFASSKFDVCCQLHVLQIMSNAFVFICCIVIERFLSRRLDMQFCLPWARNRPALFFFSSLEARRRSIGRLRMATAPWPVGSWRPARRLTLAAMTAAASEYQGKGKGPMERALDNTRGFGSGTGGITYANTWSKHVPLFFHSKI